MRRGAKPAKVKAEGKRPLARKASKKEAPRVHELEKRLAEAHAQATEAAEQQAATGEILRVISNSPTDEQPVFEAIVESARQLCRATYSAVFLTEAGQLRLVAVRGVDAAGIAALQQTYPLPIARDTTSGRAILDRRVVHLEDSRLDSKYTHPLRDTIALRSILSVPILREGLPIGALSVWRGEPEPFTDKQIALLQTFTEQAVIAIENTRLFRDLTEALEQQTGTSEILGVISRSPTDVQPTFDAIAASATQLCNAVNSLVIRFDGQLQHLAAHHNLSAERLEALGRTYPRPPTREGLSGRAILTRSVVHVPDVLEDPEYTLPVATTVGYRSALAVPMLREGIPIGTILVARDKVAPFSDKQIALLKTFADQAVIAIENVRLFTELREKNQALTEANAQVTEALGQQTATAEILRVISSSQTDIQPVFDTIIQNAVRLCEAFNGTIFRFDGSLIHVAAHHNFAPQAVDVVRRVFPIPLGKGTVTGRAILTRAVTHVPDLARDPEHTYPGLLEAGFRAVLSVPMLLDGAPIGAINVTHREPRVFSDDKIALLQTFADQAVIAIENVRLFTELGERNRELTVALDQQTATSEILRVISSSQTDVQPVFDAIVRSAVRLCGADHSVAARFDGELLHPLAFHGFSPEALKFAARSFPMRPSVDTGMGRAALSRAVVNLPDTLADPEYSRDFAIAGGWRSTLAVPMLRDGALIGAISVGRDELGEFPDQYVELLKTFADQAVIAIENVRLFKELEARTQELTQSVEQLTALGEVSRAVSSTLDVETVLQTVVSRARQLANADGCLIYEYDATTEQFHVRATDNLDAAFGEAMQHRPIRKGEGVSGHAAELGEPVQVADITLPSIYDSSVRGMVIRAGYRAALSVPLLREDEIIGSLILIRKTPGEFSPEIVEALKTFATQSALAIQNARLFREIADKSRQLEVASQHKSEFLANMSHELRTPLNAIIGFSEVLSERMFGELNEKQDEYLKDIHASGQHLLSLINDILDLSKIEAGRMELELTDFDLPAAIDNALTLVRERAGRRGIALHQAVDERLGAIRADERKLKQVLLNLLSNAIKFTPEGGRIEVRAVPVDGSVEVSVTDTGVGIVPEDQEAVFEEFRQVGTADKKVEGTGLGLALSRKFVELHGGRIWVTSEVGVGSTFAFTLPLTIGQQRQTG